MSADFRTEHFKGWQHDGYVHVVRVDGDGQEYPLGDLTAAEVGELARHMARQYGEQSYKASEEKGKEALADEMADVLWVLICLANQTGVDLTEALRKNFEKKSLRDGERHRDNKKLK